MRICSNSIKTDTGWCRHSPTLFLPFFVAYYFQPVTIQVVNLNQKESVMKIKSVSRSAFLTPRGLIGLGFSSIGLVLALLAWIALPTSSALADPIKCADPDFYQATGYPATAFIYLSTTTPGTSKIFFKVAEYSCPADPTHDSAGNATGGTGTWVGTPIGVPAGDKRYIKAVVWKSAHIDSNIICYEVDNTGL
jgi:hypothetical protein